MRLIIKSIHPVDHPNLYVHATEDGVSNIQPTERTRLTKKLVPLVRGEGKLGLAIFQSGCLRAVARVMVLCKEYNFMLFECQCNENP